MLLKSVLTSGLLALSMGVDTVEAAKFGRLGNLVRAPLERAKRVVQASHAKAVRSKNDFRFLSSKTKSE